MNKVVKITFWLVKLYDFTSQNMHYRLNRLKKSKMGKIGLKSSEIAKIGWNRAKSQFQDWFCDFDKMRPWNKIPPSWTAVRCLLDYSSIVTDSRDCLHSAFSNWGDNRATTTIYSPSSTKTAITQTITPHFTPKKERTKKTERD
jgi:hypothetical protein